MGHQEGLGQTWINKIVTYEIIIYIEGAEARVSD